jgi:hypothetical protein
MCSKLIPESSHRQTENLQLYLSRKLYYLSAFAEHIEADIDVKTHIAATASVLTDRQTIYSSVYSREK